MISGTASLVSLIPLSTGTTYRLRAESHVFGGGSTAGNFTGDAGWDFLFSVPEPTCMILVGIGAALFGGAFARQRRHW
jgi:hypothetical protein